MIKYTNHLGSIDIAHDYFVNLVGSTAENCFGVAAMSTADVKQNFIERILNRKQIDKGIKIRLKNQKLVIDLHIIVTYGTNISAIVKSIMNKVQFTVEDRTGFEVSRVNVYVDGMRTE